MLEAFSERRNEVVDALRELCRISTRIDARSLTGAEVALKKAELSLEDVEIRLEGTCGALLAVQLVAALQEKQVRWGMLRVDTLVMLIERV